LDYENCAAANERELSSVSVIIGIETTGTFLQIMPITRRV